MPNASGRRDHERREIRTNRRTQSVLCRPLRMQPDCQGQQAGAEGAETEGRGLRVGGDRTIPAARAERRGIIDRHIPGRLVHQAGGRHRPIAVCGRMPSQTLSDKLQEGVRRDRRVTQPPVGVGVSVRVHGRRVAQAFPGRVRGERRHTGRRRNRRGRPPGCHRGRRGHGGPGRLGRFFRGMIERGLKGVRPMAGGRRAGLVPTVSSMLPNAGCRRCMVRFMRSVPSRTPPAHRERASRTHPREWHDQVAGPGDPPAHARRGRLPGRERRPHAHLRRNQVCHRQRMKHPPLPGHAPARRQSHGSELIIAPWTAMIQSAQPFGHYQAHGKAWRNDRTRSTGRDERPSVDWRRGDMTNPDKSTDGTWTWTSESGSPTCFAREWACAPSSRTWAGRRAP